MDCGSLPKQTVRDTDTGPLRPARHALQAARNQASDACKSEQCDKGKCSYTETKVVGNTWDDQGTKKWISDQTSSGKCSCMEEPPNPCKKEIVQKATLYGDDWKGTGDRARAMARALAQIACESGKCPEPKGATKPVKCGYLETTIEGSTWKDAATGKIVSSQTTTGKCRCESVWL
jgi:hypothetical protein